MFLTLAYVFREGLFRLKSINVVPTLLTIRMRLYKIINVILTFVPILYFVKSWYQVPSLECTLDTSTSFCTKLVKTKRNSLLIRGRKTERPMQQHMEKRLHSTNGFYSPLKTCEQTSHGVIFLYVYSCRLWLSDPSNRIWAPFPLFLQDGVTSERRLIICIIKVHFRRREGSQIVTHVVTVYFRSSDKNINTVLCGEIYWATGYFMYIQWQDALFHCVYNDSYN